MVEDLLLMLSTAMQGYWVKCNLNQMPDAHIRRTLPGWTCLRELDLGADVTNAQKKQRYQLCEIRLALSDL